MPVPCMLMHIFTMPREMPNSRPLVMETRGWIGPFSNCCPVAILNCSGRRSYGTSSSFPLRPHPAGNKGDGSIHQIIRSDPRGFLIVISLTCRILQRSTSDPDACIWLPGARLNIAQCALSGSRRWASLGASAPSPPGMHSDDPRRPAVVYAEEGRPEVVHVVTLGQLRERAAHVACCIRAAGMAPGEVWGWHRGGINYLASWP